MDRQAKESLAAFTFWIIAATVFVVQLPLIHESGDTGVRVMFAALIAQSILGLALVFFTEERKVPLVLITLVEWVSWFMVAPIMMR